MILIPVLAGSALAKEKDEPKSPASKKEKSVQPVFQAPAKFGLSRPLRSIKPTPPGKRKTAPHWIPLYKLQRTQRKFAEVPQFDPVVQNFSLAAAMPGPLLTFDGLNNDDNINEYLTPVQPPDTNGDVGPSHYVQAVNLLYRVFNKTGTPLTAPIALGNLFAGFGGACEDLGNGDVIVLYDPLADRWIVTYIAFDIGFDPGTGAAVPVPPYHQCIACSQGADPTGAYYLYDFELPGIWLNDYPKLSVWPDAYYMTDNQFDALTEDPHGTGAFAFDRAKMLAGDASAGLIYFDVEQIDPAIDGMLPADLDGPPPPVGSPNYFVSLTADDFGDPQGDALRVFEFHADFTQPANSTFTERTESPLPTAPFDPQLFCDVSLRDCIPQPPPAGANAKLDALTDRLMHRLQYRNFGGHESLVVNHTVDVGSNHAGVRYYELRRPLPGGAFGINEQASYAPDAAHRWMGSAAMDRLGNLAVGYSVSSTTIFPSIRYAGRLASDPPGGLFQGEVTLQAGGGSQTGADSRWGDYTMLAVDPIDDCTFWYTNEYYPVSGDQEWHTRVGTFKFTGATPAPRGTLQGVVTDATSGLPLANATVRTTGGYSRATDGSGFYSMSLPTASYEVFASAINHRISATTNATISTGGTITRNFALSVVPVLSFVSATVNDTAGNNNGAVDLNECFTLQVQLQNTGAAAASNIVAMLTTAEAGVSVTQPVSSYPNITIAGTQQNATTFQVSTSPAFVCGVPIHFTLTTTHNGGTNTIPFVVNTGSGSGTALRFDSTDTPIDIFPFFGGSSAVSVTGISGSIAKVVVSLHILSDENSDLDVFLIGPNSTSVTLASASGTFGVSCNPDNQRTTFDDSAATSIFDGVYPYVGTYRPEQMLAAFNGKSGSAANGTWTLAVGNFLANATLECWSLEISEPACADGGGGCVVADTDGDGLPNWWEQFYFGSTTAAVPGVDSDGDGYTNEKELAAGTDPTNPASALRITAIQRDGLDYVVSFTSVIDKKYQVEYRNSLTAGSWSALPQVAIGSGSVISIKDAGAAAIGQRFYRVKIVQ